MSTAPRNFKFVTLSADDWRRSLRIARMRSNEALAIIKAAVKKS